MNKYLLLLYFVFGCSRSNIESDSNIEFECSSSKECQDVLASSLPVDYDGRCHSINENMHVSLCNNEDSCVELAKIKVYCDNKEYKVYCC